jgi:hypothetical protein
MYIESEREKDGRCACLSSKSLSTVDSCGESVSETFSDLNKAIDYYRQRLLLLHFGVEVEEELEGILASLRREIKSCSLKFTTEEVLFRVDTEYPQYDEYSQDCSSLRVRISVDVKGSREYTDDQLENLNGLKAKEAVRQAERDKREMERIKTRLRELEATHYGKDRI